MIFMFMVFDILLMFVFNINYSQCMFMTVFTLLLVSSQSICQSSPILSENTTCTPKSLNPKLFHMSPPYLPICGIYLPFQVNLHVPNSKPSNDNLFCMPESLMQRLGVVSIFHAMWVILTMNVYSLVIHERMACNWDAQYYDQKIKIK